MGYFITCDTRARVWPGAPRGLSPLLPTPGACAGAGCAPQGLGRGWVILGRSGSQGVTSLGAALISELVSNQGKAAVPAAPAPHPVLCSAAATTPSPSLGSGGRSHPRGRAGHGGSSPASPRAVALAHPHVPGTVSLCSARFPGGAVPGMHQPLAAPFRLKTSVCSRTEGKHRFPPARSAGE